jgi:glycine hydroxymethyltransferase
VVRNSQRFGKELKDRGFPIMFEDLGFSRSHQLLMDVKGLRAIYGLGINDFSVRMERSNLIIDSIGRLGTAEITRLGLKEKDLPALAELFIEAAKGRDVKKQVKQLRDRFDMAYRFR